MRHVSQVVICSVMTASCFCSVCEAGERGPGKYCGVVVVDRWGGCILYSGVYVTYVSEKVKDELHRYEGEAIEIDAKEVCQPINPGDGRIDKFEYLGPAPKTRNWVTLEGMHLRTIVKQGDDGKAIASIIVANEGNEPVRVFSQELALTLLTKSVSPKLQLPSDGPSFALVTRQSFETGGSEPRWQAKNSLYAWTIGKDHALPHEFTLGAMEEKQIDVRFDLPDGQYEFLCGYGGGVHEDRCVASNLSGFNIENDHVVVVSEQQR